VADQGYSEHQLGTTVDFTTPKIGGSFEKIDKEPAYQWLLENAHRYGFILSYPEGNSYYQFEPWHWRFVGVNLAIELKKQNINFYDMPQREIDTYLISIFD
ncbi:MAG: M15 family metallopeptidase, partial [Candidatus Parcubacteria bacterium]|nr:M15 family metallopeptidase [Candidatus Parcubacteria bacterium]